MSYIDNRSMSRINGFRLELENFVQGDHVVVEVFEDGRALAQDAVAAQYHVVFLQTRKDRYIRQKLDDRINKNHTNKDI